MTCNRILVILLLCSPFLLLSQELEDLNLLITDSTWKKEVFTFPLSFAKGIPYKGVEEAQFPEGWRKKESDEHWSYVFVWKIDLDAELSAKELEVDLQTYFDGIMNMKANGGEEAGILNTTVLLVEKEPAKANPRYVGKVKTFDAFFAKQAFVLNVQIDMHYCNEEKKSIIIFRFSPKDFKDDVWLKLNQVILHPNSCDP